MAGVFYLPESFNLLLMGNDRDTLSTFAYQLSKVTVTYPVVREYHPC